ncbi:MAG: AraC family transcriptional regulator [Gammaproteobacteria bacterium]
MTQEPTTLASLSMAIWEVLETHYSVNPAAVFAAAGIEKATAMERTGRIPIENVQKLWREAIRVSGDAHIGHMVGRSMRPASAYALGFAWLASSSLAEGIDRQVRYARVLTTFYGAEFETGEKESCFRVLGAGRDETLLPISADVGLTMTLRFCRLASRDDFAPLRVCFKQSLDDPTTLARYRAYFRCPVEFGAAENAIYFDTAALNEPLPAASESLVADNERMLDRYLSEVESGDFSNKVRQAVAKALPSGKVTEEEVAHRLHRSVSSLQRYLRAEGTGYRAILEETREHLAREHLMAGQHPIAEIAYLLGYADQSTFTRAFKRWTGMSPGAFAARSAGAGSDQPEA